MIENTLQGLEAVLLALFALGALAGAVLMIVLSQPMRVAVALVATMFCLAAIYGLLGVHFIAAFQILIYVGAVMVFMVYVIMLLDLREPQRDRWSALLIPGGIGFVVLLGALGVSLWRGGMAAEPPRSSDAAFGIEDFAVEFLYDYWLQFELSSVLLVAAVAAALAVIRVGRRSRDG
jgi:NADH-quinone oxidoreductase subunit J